MAAIQAMSRSRGGFPGGLHILSGASEDVNGTMNFG